MHKVLIPLMLLAAASLLSAEPKFKELGVAAPIAESRGFVAVSDGVKSYGLALSTDNSDRGYFLMIDPDTGQTEQITYPEGVVNSDPFASMLSANGRFYTAAGPTLLEFDPKTRQFLFHGIVGQGTGCIVGEAFADGPDGLIYIGAYPTCHLLSYNPQTHEIRDYGQLDPEEKYFNYLCFDDAGWAYAGIGTARCNIVAFNPKTGEKHQIVPEDERKLGTAQVYQGTDGKVYGLAVGNCWRISGGVGERIKREELKPKRPSGASGWGQTQATLPDGRTVVLNLPDSFIEVTKQGQKTRLPISYKSGGAQVTSLVVGPDNRIYSSSAHPMHFSRYDPVKDELTDLGPIYRVGGGNFCAMATQGQTIAASSYSHGIFHMFDTTKPFNGGYGNDPNPREVAVWHEDICRPRTTIAHPDGHHVIMAGFAGYGLCGGGMGIYDLHSGEATLIKHENLIPNQSTIALKALPNGNLVGGTTIEAPGGGHTSAKEGVVYLFDWPTRKVAFTIVPIPGAGSVNSLEIGGDGLVYGVAGGQLFSLDLAKKQVLNKVNLEQYGGLPRPGMVRLPDGGILILMSEAVLRLEPKTFQLTVIAKPPTGATAGPVILGNRLYYAARSRLWSMELEVAK